MTANGVDVISAVQRAKLDHRFSLLDVAGKGYLDRTDYAELARQIAGGAQLRFDDPRRQEIVDSLLGLWDILAVHADADGRLSREAWQASVQESVFEPDGFERVMEPVAASVIAGYDGDGDGELDRAEFEAVLMSIRVDAEGAAAAFARLDTRGSGKLSREQLMVALREFLVSDDPDSPGNMLLGSF
ncbi:Ca2+-binding EF-hand superfamily protein [Allocatelliglobosispora scoriae]|uniref:Ca2+-binding EF-hand superfamily protein n=1 Tax=Allocatelliglobosispora scoriae TaxID=643052 RepID=A0A841BZ89_9ACTN|nr:EF-hand domain-containing protein [Allocatelliglobosispora scoriae]MBB5872808.1 Ca2+-binding EF-hand superfamily protein [Allocatelliglobosispora scoriae]